MNKVISREYVEKNYIKKDDIKEFLIGEFKAIEQCKNKVEWRRQLDGMEAAYRTITNIFLEGTEDENTSN